MNLHAGTEGGSCKMIQMRYSMAVNCIVNINGKEYCAFKNFYLLLSFDVGCLGSEKLAETTQKSFRSLEKTKYSMFRFQVKVSSPFTLFSFFRCFRFLIVREYYVVTQVGDLFFQNRDF